MKKISILFLALVLMSCASDAQIRQNKYSGFKGISFEVFRDQAVVAVDRVAELEIVQADIKSGQANAFKVRREIPSINRAKKLKAAFINAQFDESGNGESVWLAGQSDTSIILVDAGPSDPTVLICGTIQRPCAVDDPDLPVAQGGCHTDFGEPQGTGSVSDFFGNNEDNIKAFCEKEQNGGGSDA